jgi:HAD superfamily hydrolase (TIGR01549 family)
VASQAYANIEVIIVDSSASSSVEKMVAGHQRKHGNVERVALDPSAGIFKSKLEGFRIAAGDYIVPIESEDDISIDYVRSLVAHAKHSEADIVIAETVIKEGASKFIFNLANDLPFDSLTGEECFERFMEQHGENHNWQMIGSKIYSRRVVDQALSSLSEVNECTDRESDVLISTVLWSFAQRVDRLPTAYYYTSKDVGKVDHHIGGSNSKIPGNVIEFLRSRDIYPKFETTVQEWEHGHASDNEATSQFYRTKTPFNGGLEELKTKILDESVRCVSFDIFDTLVTRPFLVPSDLFYLLDGDFKAVDGEFRLQTFHDIRIKAEEIARQKTTKEDVGLAEIYQVIQDEYSVSAKTARHMLDRELEYEITYCSQRKTAKELYDLVLYLGKKIIITSDMYLPKHAIETILENCGFSSHHALYLSSHHGTMKATQNLYKHIISELSVSPDSMLHIGDNSASDVVAAKAAGWQAVHFPKGTELVSFNSIIGANASYARNQLGITTAYAVALNKYFDNPFRSFHEKSNYNSSPYFMGYFSLGLAMFGFTRWMAEDFEDRNIKSAVFLSRDGYLPMQVFAILQEHFSLPVKIHYLPTSRKAIIPLSIFGRASLSDIQTFNYRGKLTPSVLRALSGVMKKGIDSRGMEGVDFSKVKELQGAFVKTYRNYFQGNTAVVDIGYSGRPEQVFKELFHTPIQTYFVYTANDEAKRRLSETVSIYSGLNASGIVYERVMSDLTPSCIGYEVVNSRVEPVMEPNHMPPYYERYVISEMQRGALDFAKDYLSLFRDHLGVLNLGVNASAIRPLEQAIQYSAPADREVFRGLIHEDDIAGDNSISVFDEYYSYLNRLESETERLASENVTLHEEKDQLASENTRLHEELSSHFGIKRSARLLAGNVKRRVKYGKKR